MIREEPTVLGGLVCDLSQPTLLQAALFSQGRDCSLFAWLGCFCESFCWYHSLLVTPIHTHLGPEENLLDVNSFWFCDSVLRPEGLSSLDLKRLVVSACCLLEWWSHSWPSVSEIQWLTAGAWHLRSLGVLSKDDGIFSFSPLLLPVTEYPSSTELLNFLQINSYSVSTFCLCLLYPFLPKLVTLLLNVPHHPYCPPVTGFLFHFLLTCPTCLPLLFL